MRTYPPLLLTASVLAFILGLPSCASTRVGSDAADVNNSNTIRGDEWEAWAGKFYEQIVASAVWPGLVGSATMQSPLVLGIDDFHLQGGRLEHRSMKTDRLVMYNALRSKFVNGGGGRVVVNMDITGNKAAKSERSSLVNNVRDGARGSTEYKQDNVPGLQEMLAPTVGLQGSIVPVKIEQEGGRGKRTDYQVQFRLVDLRRGVSLFEGYARLPKSFKPGFFGG